MSASTALEARRDALREREAGFTLIELLVVVIIIGILAAIAIPVYLGVQNNAKDAAVKSDLVHDKGAIVIYGADNNGYIPAAVTNDPTGSVAANTTTGAAAINLSKSGWSKSTNTSSLVYTASGATSAAGVWCLTGTSTSTKSFYISSSKPVTGGSCPTDSTLW